MRPVEDSGSDPVGTGANGALRRDLGLWGAVVTAGMLAGLIPGARAYRLSLADGLSPRS